MAGPETTHLDYSVSRPWFLGLLPLPPSFRKATSLPKPPPSPKGLGSRHDGGREASFTAAVAEAATTVAISGLSTPERWRARGDLGGVPCPVWLVCLLPA